MAFNYKANICYIKEYFSEFTYILLFRILPHVRGNVGFVFTAGELSEVREKLLENKVRAPARPNAIAPCDVIIPAQNTGLGPEKTSFFQALAIATKISKGTIEIINDVHIVKVSLKFVITLILRIYYCHCINSQFPLFYRKEKK